MSPNPLDGSDIEELEDLVASEVFWELLEAHEESCNRARRGPKRGRPRQYVPADIVVIEAATHQNSSARSTLRNLKDPKTWKRLRKAAKKNFPNNKARRLSKKAPNRWQIYRAQRNLFSGENLQEFRRLMRHESLKGAIQIGCFDPAAGTWTHPDKTQCIVADASWIRSATQYDRSVLLDPHSKVQRFDPNAYPHHYSNNEPTKFPGREVVMLSCRSNFGNERIILDSDFLPHNKHHSRKGRNDADFAVDMLADLINEHRSLLGGLRGFTYDMAMDSEAIDNVLAQRVIPIVKTQKLPNKKYRHGNIGGGQFWCCGW